jgi:hypothetical protein
MDPSISDPARLVAWNHEIRRMHARLREALAVARDAGPTDLLLYCHGVCTALDGHHRGEDGTLFPAVAAARPELAPVLRTLEQDHSMIARLIAELRTALDGGGPVDRHLDGLGAIMENHFRYEEKVLDEILATLELDADPAVALGPL